MCGTEKGWVKGIVDGDGWGEGWKIRGSIDVGSPWEQAAVESRLDFYEALTPYDPRGKVWQAILKIKQATPSLFSPLLFQKGNGHNNNKNEAHIDEQARAMLTYITGTYTYTKIRCWYWYNLMFWRKLKMGNCVENLLFYHSRHTGLVYVKF